MAYNDNELSRRDGKPRELFKFEGTYATYCYTSGTKKVRYPDVPGGDVYLPITLDRSEVNAGTPDDDGLNFSVTLPVSAEVCRVYAFSDAPPDLDLKVFRYHTIDAVAPYWSGRVTDIGIENGMVTFTTPSVLASALEGVVTDVLYQDPCNHTLYDARCGIAYEDYSLQADILAIDDKLFTVDGLAALDGMLIGGEFVLDSGERRMIVEQAGNVLTLNFALPSAAIGDTVTIAAGCDYAWAGDCKTKFANQLRFGGFPFIPDSNVFEGGIEPGSRLADQTCVATCAPPPGFYAQLTWQQPMNPGNTPGIYSGDGGTGNPQNSGVFPNGAYLPKGAQIFRSTLSPGAPGQGNYRVVDFPGGWEIRDFGDDGFAIVTFRLIYSGESVVGYRWDFGYEFDPIANHSFAWSHQIQRSGFPSGDDFPAMIEVGLTNGGVIATAATVVYRTFPQGFGINY